MGRTNKIKYKATQAERKQAQQEIGSLKVNKVAERTFGRYAAALAAFIEWKAVHFPDTPRNDPALASLFADFISDLWIEGHAKAQANDVLPAAAFFKPKLKGMLKEAWALMSVWNKLEEPVRATPFLPIHIKALVGYFLALGYSRLALVLSLAWHLFLRTKEFLDLKAEDTWIAPDLQSAVLCLGYTKSGKRRGEKDSLLLEDVGLVTWLASVFGDLLPQDSIIGLNVSQFRAHFHDALVHLGIATELYRPYSLRRGGATQAFRSGMKWEQLMNIGRWQHLHTCRVYIQDASQEAARASLSKPATRRLSYYSRDVATATGYAYRQEG